MLKGKTIVLFSAVAWSGIHARPQQLAGRFAKNGARILFVEPAGSLLSPLKQRDIPLTSNLRMEEASIAVLTPPLLAPAAYASPLINRLNQRLLWRVIERALRQLGWKVDLVFTHLPGSVDLPTSLPIVYDCVDDHIAFSSTSYLWRADVVKQLEERLLRQAHRVFASSDKLLAKCKKLRTDTVLIANGADFEHFNPAAQAKSGALKLTGPIIGFYGGIGPWIDLEIVAEAAISKPDLSFVMLGPVDSAVKVPQGISNLHFKGLIPYQELPQYLADFDVALIPFKNNELTQSVNPIKLYEYFAAGKSVIVSEIPELTRWQPLVYPATTASELLKQIDAAMGESPHLSKQRQQIAAENSWDARVEAIVKELGEHSNG